MIGNSYMVFIKNDDLDNLTVVSEFQDINGVVIEPTKAFQAQMHLPVSFKPYLKKYRDINQNLCVMVSSVDVDF